MKTIVDKLTAVVEILNNFEGIEISDILEALSCFFPETSFTVRELPAQPEQGQEENQCGKCGKWYQGGVGACPECNPKLPPQPEWDGAIKKLIKDMIATIEYSKSFSKIGLGKSIFEYKKRAKELFADGTASAVPAKTVALMAGVDDKNLLQLLSDCAECLDDCLIRIYPEEFEQKHIDKAGERFSKGHGTIARISNLVEKIKMFKSAKPDNKILLDLYRQFLAAWNRCESSRGCYSCTEPHDCRCEKEREISELDTCHAQGEG